MTATPQRLPRNFEKRTGSAEMEIPSVFRSTQRKLVYPSTGSEPGFQTIAPCSTRFFAYRYVM